MAQRCRHDDRRQQRLWHAAATALNRSQPSLQTQAATSRPVHAADARWSGASESAGATDAAGGRWTAPRKRAPVTGHGVSFEGPSHQACSYRARSRWTSMHVLCAIKRRTLEEPTRPPRRATAPRSNCRSAGKVPPPSGSPLHAAASAGAPCGGAAMPTNGGCECGHERGALPRIPRAGPRNLQPVSLVSCDCASARLLQHCSSKVQQY